MNTLGPDDYLADLVQEGDELVIEFPDGDRRHVRVQARFKSGAITVHFVRAPDGSPLEAS